MTTWISHRGYSKHATENTVQAFDDAIALGFDHLETDLRTTSDGHIVLCHDPDLTRVSGHDSIISESSRKDLEAVTLSKGEPLLFFDEFVERYSDFNWILDIKPDSAEHTIASLRQWLKSDKAGSFLRQRARFLMWQPEHERQIRHVIDNAFCLAGEKACIKAGVAALAGLAALAIKPRHVYAVPPKIRGVPLLTRSLLKRYHKQGAKVIGYLPETVAEHEQALRAGVDELLTNHAQLLPTLTKPT